MTGGADPWVHFDGRFLRASRAGMGLGLWRPWEDAPLAENLPCGPAGPRDLKAHLARLEEGSRVLGWPAPPRRGLGSVLAELARRNGVEEGGLRLRWWGGLTRPLLLAQCVRSSLPKGPLDLATSTVRHHGPDALEARLKSGDMLAQRLARAEVEAFAEDGLRLGPAGLVAEGSFSNLAALRRGVLRTPPASQGLLEGITRASFLARARRRGLDVREEPLTRHDLWCAERAWVLSSLRGPLEVRAVDGRRLGGR